MRLLTMAPPAHWIGRETHPPACLRSTKSAKWTWESATQVEHLSDIIRLRAARVVDSSREIDVVVAGAACGPSGLAEKSRGLRGTGGLAVANLAAANIGRVNHRTNSRRIPSRTVGQKR